MTWPKFDGTALAYRALLMSACLGAGWVGHMLYSHNDCPLKIAKSEVKTAVATTKASEAARTDERKAVVEVNMASAKVSAKIDQANADTQTAIERLPEDVPTAQTIIVPAAYLRLYAYTYTGAGSALSASLSGADEAAGGLPLAVFGVTDLYNAGLCRAIREQLIGLQGYENDRQAFEAVH